MKTETFIKNLTVNICDLGDRTTPEEYPDMLMVTGKEIDGLVSNLLEVHRVVPAELDRKQLDAFTNLLTCTDEEGMETWDAILEIFGHKPDPANYETVSEIGARASL